MPSPKKPRAIVEPHFAAIFPTGFKHFVLKVDGEPETWARSTTASTWRC